MPGQGTPSNILGNTPFISQLRREFCFFGIVMDICSRARYHSAQAIYHGVTHMAESQPFKNYYGVELAEKMAGYIRGVYPAFDGKAFVQHVAKRVEPLELKARVSLLSEGLRRYLPPDYPQALSVLMQILGPENPDENAVFDKGYHLLPIAQFVEDYGLDHYERSMHALYEITKRFSSEFAIRPYLIRYPERTLAALHEWARDENHHVRRLVSEGTRSRLPWAARLDMFIRDPEPVIALLEHLKDDPSPYVRRSVANNLNDIVKDHPARVISLLQSWKAGASEGTKWIIRHALRTLVKKGEPAALALLGYETETAVSLVQFAIQPETIRLGEPITLSATLENPGQEDHDLVIDFRMHLVKANGKTSPKVFKWTTTTIKSGETFSLEKKMTIRQVTTRTYYPGRHEVELQVNGRVLGKAAFELNL